MRLRNAHVLAVAVLSVMIFGGTSVAFAQANEPRTKRVSGMFTASPQNVKQRFCTGQDGEYVEIRGHFSGVITSDDPRLAGNLEFIAEPALVNLTNGFGTFRGRFRIADATTGAQKAQGEFLTVVTDRGLNHGFAHGKVMNAGAGPADNFFANFKSTLDGSLNVSGQFGGDGDSRTPAVVQGGLCSGPFLQVP
jgi:hypothetical protein